MSSVPAGIFATYDAILSALTTSAAANGWSLYDGPTPTGSTPNRYVVLGSDDTGLAGDIVQDWHTLGLQPNREETGVIHGLIVSSDGSATEMAATRGRVRDTLADVDAAVRSINSATGLDMIHALVGAGQLFQVQAAAGLEVKLTIQIAYRVILTTW